jgi:hypothetical protein
MLSCSRSAFVQASVNSATPLDRILWHAILPVLVVVLLACSPAHAQNAIGADQFVDSVGVNIHLHYDGTLYRDNFDLVKDRLIELGVRHERDGMIDTTWQEYYDRHNALGNVGIKGVFVTNPGQSAALLQNYPSRVPSSFEAYEAANEYNGSGDPAWATTLRNSLMQLRALRDIPSLARFQVLGPSLTQESAYSTLGDVSALIDAGNMHNYLAGRHPGTAGWGGNGYGSIDWNLALVKQSAGAKPIVTTETGYQDYPAGTDTLPQDVVGKYMPRLLLEQFRKGIARTYIHELCDFGAPGDWWWSGSFGLLNPDGSRKPAFKAVSGLLSLLTDPGPNFTPQPLAYSLQGADADVRHMAFQKRDGSYYLAVWLELPGYDVLNKTAIPVTPRSVTVTTPGDLRAVNAHRWEGDGSVTRNPLAPSTSPTIVSVTDRLLILEFRNPLVLRAPANLRLGP